MTGVALEVEDGVDHVLEHARTGDGTVFGDVPDDAGGDALALGDLHQLTGALAHLADRAGGRLEGGGEDGLDRVDDEEVGLEVAHALADDLEGGLGEQVEIVGRHPEAGGAQFDLAQRLFGGHVKGAAPCGQARDGLQQQRRLADAGVAADQRKGAGNQAAAEHPVELADAAAVAVLFGRCHLGQPLRAGPAGGIRRAALARLGDEGLLGEGVPLVAVGAFAEPLGALVAALLTGKNRFVLQGTDSGIRPSIGQIRKKGGSI